MRRTGTPLCSLLALVVVYPTALAQSATNVATFEVASVRLNRSGNMGSSISRSGGTLTFSNVSLREVIAFGYGIAVGREYELSGPAWLNSERFDIATRFAAESSRDKVREMVRTLLVERFSLKTRRDEKNVRAYALVEDKRGAQLRKGSDGDDGSFGFRDGHVTVRALSMASFASDCLDRHSIWIDL